MTASLPIHETVPVIGTDDIRRSLIYYTEVLGFTEDFSYGDPLVYAGVKSAGKAELYFTLDVAFADAVRRLNLKPEIFLWIPDAENLFKAHAQNGAEIIEPVADRPWGAKQYVVRDINGYYLKFAQPL